LIKLKYKKKYELKRMVTRLININQGIIDAQEQTSSVNFN
jgi:hypothetical protein